MTEEQIELARRAVACKGWRWMEGMATLNGSRVTWVDTDMQMDPDSLELISVAGGTPYDGDHRIKSLVPNLQDPATLGCLLALVREAWGDECVCVLPVDYGPGGVAWFCRLTAGGRELTRSYVRGGMGEAEALIAALEAAP